MIGDEGNHQGDYQEETEPEVVIIEIGDRIADRPDQEDEEKHQKQRASFVSADVVE